MRLIFAAILLLLQMTFSIANFKDYARIHLPDVQKSVINKLIDLLNDQGITLGHYISHGTYGAVIEGTIAGRGVPPKVALKIMKVDSSLECDQTDIIKKLKKLSAKHILEMFDQKYFEIVSEYTVDKFCVLALELGVQPLDKPIFSSTGRPEVITEKFLDIVGKIIEGIGSMNHVAGYTHGDIKPPNMILVDNNGVLEPRIIDFDMSFQPNNVSNRFGSRRLDQIIYTKAYRPPEMLVFCPDNNCNGFSDDEYPELRYKFYSMYYQFDPEHKEDSFALGVSLNEIIALNKKSLSSDFLMLERLKTDIIPMLTLPDPTMRWTTKQAENEFTRLKGKYGLNARLPYNEPKFFELNKVENALKIHANQFDKDQVRERAVEEDSDHFGAKKPMLVSFGGNQEDQVYKHTANFELPLKKDKGYFQQETERLKTEPSKTKNGTTYQPMIPEPTITDKYTQRHNYQNNSRFQKRVSVYEAPDRNVQPSQSKHKNPSLNAYGLHQRSTSNLPKPPLQDNFKRNPNEGDVFIPARKFKRDGLQQRI
jgi:serine/threonine protein kinase